MKVDVRDLYVDLLVRCITNTIYGDANTNPKRSLDYDPARRHKGTDWPEVAHTMIGVLRMNNLRHAVETVLKEGIPGDLIETGVWRGGACILMRGILKAYGDGERRVFVADSFQGLPPPDADRYPADAGQKIHKVAFLAVSKEMVESNFRAYDLLDTQVVFLQGWFKDTLPAIQSNRFSVVRLDGDLYESTIQALDVLYPKLSPGGFLIVDDYGSWPNCKAAVTDYRTAHGIDEPIVKIDGTGVFWRKRMGD